MGRVDEQELRAVARCVESARRLRLTGAARAITRSSPPAVSWSRVALGHHYWTDILAGMVLGSVIAAAVTAVVL